MGNREAIKEGDTTQWKKNNRTNSNLQNITQKTKDRKRTTLKTRVNSCAPEG